MSRICELCGRRPSRGMSISRRGLAKVKGGVGRKITGSTKRSFKPNIQRIRVVWEGRARRMKVCTTCLRSGKIVKPLLGKRRPAVQPQPA